MALRQMRIIIITVFVLFYFAMILLMTSPVSSASASTTLPPYNSYCSKGQVPQAAFVSKQGYRSMERVNAANKLGSRPPRCEHKCGGCVPCYATQVPSLIDGVKAQYANYEPEGWKCKCGSSFFNP